MARASLSEALVLVQFFVAMWQLIQLTPVALLLRGLYLFTLEFFCLMSQNSERIILNTQDMANVKSIKMQSAWATGGVIEIAPIIHASQTYDYFDTASMGWINGTYVDEEIIVDVDTFECIWLNKKLKFSRRKDETHPHAYYIMCETKGARILHTYYVPDFPNRIWSDIYDYFYVKHNITLKNKFKLVSKLEYAELCSFSEVLHNMIVKGERVCVGGPLVFLPKTKCKETKFLACLNLLGLYGQIHDWKMEVITFITLLSCFLQFFEGAREWIYAMASHAMIVGLQALIDSIFPIGWRAFLYSFRDWNPNLQPCNDVQMRVIRGGDTNSTLYFFSFGNVECGHLIKVCKGMESIPRVPNTYALAHVDARSSKLVGGFGNDRIVSSDPSDFSHVVAIHICRFGGGALDYCRGNHVHLKSLKESFDRPYHCPRRFDTNFVIWETNQKVVIR